MQLTQIIDLIADHCVLDANDLNADTLLSDHLDSLDLSEVVATIEHRACIDISDADLATCRTIGDLHRVVMGVAIVRHQGGALNALQIGDGERRYLKSQIPELLIKVDTAHHNKVRFAYGFVFGLLVILVIWLIH